MMRFVIWYQVAPATIRDRRRRRRKLAICDELRAEAGKDIVAGELEVVPEEEGRHGGGAGAADEYPGRHNVTNTAADANRAALAI